MKFRGGDRIFHMNYITSKHNTNQVVHMHHRSQICTRRNLIQNTKVVQVNQVIAELSFKRNPVMVYLSLVVFSASTAMPLQTQSRPTFRYLLRRIKRQELSASAVLLHYDSQASDLKPWLWYDLLSSVILIIVSNLFCVILKACCWQAAPSTV